MNGLINAPFRLRPVWAIYLSFTLLNLSVANAQQCFIKRVELADQKVIVHYDLIDSIPGRSFTMNVYGSHDNYLNPLTKITGDLGMEVKPGLNKKITWDAKTELGDDFDGSVALEIRGRLFIPFIRLSGFEDYKSFKRGKPYTITWSGGTSQNILNFDLYRKEKRINTFANVANVGNYKFTVPKDAKPGKDYRFRISDSKNKNEVVYTGTFKVKRKTPNFLKVLLLAGIGYGIYAGSELLNTEDTIPDPITPTGN
ncbi:MAG: GPI anchored serine-threonine rich family protein [Cyclobacteriaceae bacterium]|nr:GPI anchored serine-threonine rich family protein [Cyclobacteriaceae bacterium]